MKEMFLSISIPVLIISLVVAAVVVGIRMFKDKGKNLFTMKMLWVAYLYIMCLISLMLFLYGGIRFTTAIFAHYTSAQFSYQTYEYVTPIPEPGTDKPLMEPGYDILKDPDQKLIEVDGKKYTYNYGEYKADMVDGLVMFFSLLIIYAIHRYLVSKADTDKDSFMRKIYDFIGLAQYGILSIIAIPSGIYALVKYLMDDINLSSYTRPVPGTAIALLLFVVPAWIIFMLRMIKENKTK
ncbi:hypothetical protein IT417_02485 [bacterium]|nr:hypothetical protein [bacterium]